MNRHGHDAFKFLLQRVILELYRTGMMVDRTECHFETFFPDDQKHQKCNVIRVERKLYEWIVLNYMYVGGFSWQMLMIYRK